MIEGIKNTKQYDLKTQGIDLDKVKNNLEELVELLREEEETV